MIRYLDRLERDLERRRHVCEFTLLGRIGICTEEGIDIYECKGCLALVRWTRVFAEHVIPGALAATCTEDGYTGTGACVHCKIQVTGTIIPTLGHDWSYWTVYTPATYTSDGEERRTCLRDNCGYFVSQVIPMLVSLRLNEINGVQNYIELFNLSRKTIELEDFEIKHINEHGATQVLWTGTAGEEILPLGFLTIGGAQLTHALPLDGIFTIELRHQDYNVLDTFHRPGDDAAMNTLFGVGNLFNSNMGSKRIPDGTGNWYFFSGANGSQGVTNSTSVMGLISGEPPDLVLLTPQSPLFWLRLNELNGVISNDRIYIELFNMGSAHIDLEGIQIYIKDYNFNPALYRVTEGRTGETITANGFKTFVGRGDRLPPNNRIVRGMSSSRAITVTLKDSEGRIIDRYNRAKADHEMNAWTNTHHGIPWLFGSSMGSKRIPDGTGAWYFFSGFDHAGDHGTPNAPNPSTPAGLIVGHPTLVIRVPYE